MTLRKYGEKRTWTAATLTDVTGVGTDKAIVVKDRCWVEDEEKFYVCSAVAATSSTWAAASGAASFPTISAIDITALSGVQAAWDMDDDLTDRSGNGLDLATGATIQYATIQGKRCAIRGAGTSLGRAANDSELTITGALTVSHLVYGTPPGNSNNKVMFAFSGAGGAEAENFLYSLKIATGSAGETFYAFTESGAGSGNTEQFLSQHVPGSWALFTYTQDSAGTTVNLYINGKLSGASPLTSVAPTGGTGSRFALYDQNVASSGYESWVGDTVIQNVEMTAAQILTMAQQVGVAP